MYETVYTIAVRNRAMCFTKVIAEAAHHISLVYRQWSIGYCLPNTIITNWFLLPHYTGDCTLSGDLFSDNVEN